MYAQGRGIFTEAWIDNLSGFAKEAFENMLSYNVSKTEAVLYLTNEIEIVCASYELQCCICDTDYIGYSRECDKAMNEGKECLRLV